ncbi:hypothetical protein ABZZ79_18165 [Streptomyces sp. NPDC006458]|uniref:hypothetical protein n=1 Tax=Streptomyces sp. NPDC006458 TaxID=3154302 RepID=UPI0033AF8B29
MTTLTTAVVRILHWAITDPGAQGPPPREPGSADPVLLLERLARVTAARLQLSDPPLGDPGPAGLDPLLIAAAVAVRQDPTAARTALEGAREPASVRDVLARHGLVAHALATAPPEDPLRPDLLRASPLTALLDHPAPGGEERCAQLLDRLLDHPEGRRAAVAALAAPPGSPETARYRASLLRRFRFTPGEREFVYDVYETALLRHAGTYRRHTDRVRDLLRDSPARLLADDAGGRWALATMDWWEPLAVIARRHPQELRRRRMLQGYGTGVALQRTYGRIREWEDLREVLGR